MKKEYPNVDVPIIEIGKNPNEVIKYFDSFSKESFDRHLNMIIEKSKFWFPDFKIKHLLEPLVTVRAVKYNSTETSGLTITVDKPTKDLKIEITWSGGKPFLDKFVKE